MLYAKMFFSESDEIIGSFHLINNQDNNWAFKSDLPRNYKQLVSF